MKYAFECKNKKGQNHETYLKFYKYKHNIHRTRKIAHLFFFFLSINPWQLGP